MNPDWRLISDDHPPLDTGVLVSDGKDVTAALWITDWLVVPYCAYADGDGTYLSFEPVWWIPLPEPPRKDTT